MMHHTSHGHGELSLQYVRYNVTQGNYSILVGFSLLLVLKFIVRHSLLPMLRMHHVAVQTKKNPAMAGRKET